MSGRIHFTYMMVLMTCQSITWSVCGSQLFLGGVFTDDTPGTDDVNDFIRENLGIYDSQYYQWDDQLNNEVSASVVWGSHYDATSNVLYVVGDMVGSDNNDYNVIGYDLDDRANMQYIGSTQGGSPHTVFMHQDILYIGGDFDGVNSVTTGSLAQWDGADWTSVDISISGDIQSLFGSGDKLFIGGLYDLSGNETRVSMLDISGGTITPLNVICDGTVKALHYVDPTLYIGGDFTTSKLSIDTTCVNANVKGLYALDTVSLDGGSPITISQFTGFQTINTFSSSPTENEILIGGKFSDFGLNGLYSLARFNISTNILLPLSDQVPYDSDLEVFGIDISTDSIFIAGHFTDSESVYGGAFFLNEDSVWELLNYERSTKQGLGLTCSVCGASEPLPIVYTVSVLPDGEQPDNWVTESSSSSGQVLLGSNGGLFAELGLYFFPGLEIFNMSSSSLQNATLTSWTDLTGELGWIFWAGFFGALFVLAFILAVIINCCFKICGTLKSIGNDSLSDSSSNEFY